MQKLKINEIFYSIQGESTHAGRPTIFIRLTGCNLRCTYCDTEYAYHNGENKTFNEILCELRKYPCQLIELTGGEPLMEKEGSMLADFLCKEGYEVMVETNGTVRIPQKRVFSVVMDIKCPASGEAEKFDYKNLDNLKKGDELKFVVSDRQDFDWAMQFINDNNLINKQLPLIFSPVFSSLEPATLVEWILKTGKPIRMQLQMHKFIWSPEKRGV